MTNFRIKNFQLFISIAIILTCNMSCQNNNQEQVEPYKQVEFNSYKLFEEPSAEQIKNLQFYFLAAYWGGLENTYLLSIRKDSDNNSYGYYKVIDRDIMPPIANAIKTDTLPFVYLTTYFKLKSADIDTLKKLIQIYQISKLKDTLLGNDLDSKTREIIVYHKERFLNIFRSGSESSIEKNYADFFKTVVKKFTPPEPVPYFRR